MDEYYFEKEEIIQLNVGGRIFKTYLSTLQKNEFSTSLLGIMFSPRNKHLLKPNERGEYFFDRSPDLFEYIINYYRTNELDIPISIPYKIFIKELDYFQMPHHSTNCNNQTYNFNNMNSFKLNLNSINNNNNNNNNNCNSTSNNNNNNNIIINQQLKHQQLNLSPRLLNNVLSNNINGSNNTINGNSGNNSNSNSNSNSPRILNNNDNIINNNNNTNLNNETNNCNNSNNINNDNNNNQNNNFNNNNLNNDKINSKRNSKNEQQICTCNNMLLGERLKLLSLDKARKDGGDMLELIKGYCYDILIKAAEQGKQYEIIQFKSSDTEIEKYYSFISNLRNRELFLLDLMNDGFDVNFSEEFGRYCHSYLLQITFWSRYSTSSNDQVLHEIKQKIIQLSAFIYKKG